MNDFITFDELSTDFVSNEISKYYPLGSNKDKILFVGHDANSGGAEILLKNIINEFKNRDIEVVIFIKKDGPLLESYKNLAPTFIIDNKKKLIFI